MNDRQLGLIWGAGNWQYLRQTIFLTKSSLGEADLEAMLESAGFVNPETTVVDKDAEASQFQTLLAIADKRK
ncbi:MAG: hypothetical protein P4K93_03765 [Terracidiphilus sp.]|nr:hypothetical protein [Terracidiphilus sp.]MDR3797242.1 hypothetical protein [Terracidiphilus sp.]